jgi:hypothetical protein
MNNSVSPKRVLVVLVVTDILMGILHLLFSTHTSVGEFFNLASEENLPTLYSSLQFFLVAMAAVFSYFSEKEKQALIGYGWLVVAAFMLGLAVDETFQIHEALISKVMAGPAGEGLRNYFGATQDTDSLLWTVVFAPPMILAAVGLMLFYYSRFKHDRQLFTGVLLSLSLLFLAAGLEYLEAKSLSNLVEDSLKRYQLFTFVEEMVELLAASLLVWAHYSYGWKLEFK